MTVYEIASANNRFTGKQMIFAEDKAGRFYLIINGTNQKVSSNRESVENLFKRLSK